MAQQFLVIALLVITVLVTFCAAGGSHHKHIIIHVPYHVKHHHHTHTIFKHIKHIDHGHHDHHDHHDHHGHDDDYKISFPGNHFDFGGWSGEYGSIGDVGGGYDGGFDSGSYENNNFGSLGWDDK